jgi:hypothetical protein
MYGVFGWTCVTPLVGYFVFSALLGLGFLAVHFRSQREAARAELAQVKAALRDSQRGSDLGGAAGKVWDLGSSSTTSGSPRRPSAER